MPNLQGMYDWAVDWCNRANVAYDQSYRTMQVRPSDSCTCFDCSSFTFFALWLGGGWDLSPYGYSTSLSDYTSIPRTANAWAVTGMVRCLPGLGWNAYNIGSITPQAGDIVVKTAQHCEIVYSDSPLTLMGARNSSLPLDDQVSIHQVSSLSWYDQIWRYGAGPTPPVPGDMPVSIWLLKRAHDIAFKGGLI